MMRLRKILLTMLALGALALVASACSGSQSAGDGATRQVLVDYVHDEVASSFLSYFPRNVTVRPGDTVQFRQEWTGEPHSVTMGTMVDDMMGIVGPLLEKYGDSPEEPPPDVLATYEAATEGLPWMLPEDPREPVNQNAAQPCYLEEGGPPEDPARPCADEDQVQPAFNGRQSYYNSGFIPYEGPQGNQFDVELAEDIEPGVYNYYCNLHGPFQAGTITVVEEDEEIPSAEEVARQAQAEIEEQARPIIEAYNEARAGRTEIFGERVDPPLAGWATESNVHAFVSEFIPETIRVEAGEPVSWSFVGGHTVSFEVPSYFSQMTVEDDGTVIFNPDALLPVNSPEIPMPEGPAPGDGGSEPPPEEAGNEPPPDDAVDQEAAPDVPPPPVEIDAGEWDGREFISSGVFYDGVYTITFTRPGTYPYACLIHPQMVGAVVVEEA